MRIILLVAFYIYVARIADGEDTATTMSGHSMRHISKHKDRTTQGKISEIPIDEIQKIHRHSRHLLLVNRLDGFPQSKNNLARVKRNLRRKKRRAKDLNSKIARRQHDFQNDDDIDEEDVLSSAKRLQGFPIWQVPESTLATINLDSTNPTIIQTKIINQSLLTSAKSQLENVNSERSLNETILSAYSDSRKSSDKNIFDKNFFKIANPKYEIKSNGRPAFKKLNDKILLPAYRSADMDLPNFSRPQGFQWRYAGYQKGASGPHNIKEESSNYHLTSPNRRFLLVPVSKDLYVLKDVQDSSGTDTDRTIISNKLSERKKDNATSAILSFKAHLHHDVKDAGNAYLAKDLSDYQSTDHRVNYLHSDLDYRVFEKNPSTTENSMAASYPSFLYSDIAFQTHPNLIDVAPEIPDEQITRRVPDYENISLLNDDINLDDKTDFYYSLLSTSSSFDMSDYELPSYLKEGINNAENNQDTIKDNGGSIPSISNGYNNKKSTDINDFNHDNKFIDKALFSDYTIEKNSFLNTYTTSASSISDTDEWSLKKKQSNVENPRALLMALEPLSSELQKLLSAVELVNQSISNVQNRLCDKKDTVRSARIEDNKEGKVANIANPSNDPDHYDSDLPTESFDNQTLAGRQIKTKNRIIVDQTTNSIKSRKRTKNYFLFLDKLTTPLYKRGSSAGKSKIQADRRNFHTKGKLTGKEFLKLDGIRRRRLPHSRFNRNLKSLTKNYGMQKVKSSHFTKSKSKRITRATAPILPLSRLMKSNVSSKNNFSNGRVQNFQENYNKLIPLSNDEFLDTSMKKDNRAYFLSDNKRDPTQRSAKRMSNEMYNPDKEKNFSFVDPQSYREATAYLEILGLLDKKPHRERTVVTWTTQNVTEPLLVSTTAEFFATTASLPYFIEEPTITVLKTTTAEREEFPEVTESIEYATSTDFEYYGEDYDERNYTGAYKDYEYEDQEKVTPWYEYTEETATAAKEVGATTIETFIPEIIFSETTSSVKITKIETSTETLIRYSTVEYPFTFSALIEMTTVPPVTTSEIFEITSATQLPVTLSAFTMPTTLPLFYITELTTLSIGETILFREVTAEKATITLTAETSVAIPTTEKFTTKPVILLTPLLEGMPDITLRITIPAVTETSTKETLTTKKEMIEITWTTLATEITQSLLTETSVPLYKSSTAPLFTETESAIPITTPIVPILTSPIITERPQTTTSTTSKTISVTEKTITVTAASPITTTIESTTALGESTTLYEAVTSKIIYVTRIKTEMEDVTPFTTRTLIFTTRAPTTVMKITEKVTLVTEKPGITSIKGMTIPKKLETISTEIITQASIATETTTSVTESFYTSTDTFAEMFMENATATISTQISTEKAGTYITTVAASTQVTEIMVETSATPITITEIITTRAVTATTTSSPTISERTETILGTSTEIVITTSMPEEESPVTQIEKTITAEETTTTETPTPTEISTSTETLTATEIPTTTETMISARTLMPTKNLTTAEISTIKISTLTPTITKTTEVSTTREITTTKVLMPTGTPTITETPLVSETSTTSEIPVITEITTTVRTLTPTAHLTTIKTTSPRAPTITKTSATAKISTTKESTTVTEIRTPTKTSTTTETSLVSETSISETPMITEITTITETSTVESTIITKIQTTETPMVSEISTSIETPTTTEITKITKILTPTETSTTLMISETSIETPTTTEITTITETPTVEMTTITEILASTETLTITEILIVSETSTSEAPMITEITTITETSTVESTTITEIQTTETAMVTETSTSIETPMTTEITTTIKILTPTETSTTLMISETSIETPTTTEITTITETPTVEMTTITEILTSTSTITEILIVSETSTSEAPTTAETAITTEISISTEIPTTTVTPILTEILTITETPTITKTSTINETLPTVETQTTMEIPTTESSTIIETTTISSTYITTFFSIEGITSSVVTMAPTKEFVSTLMMISETSTTSEAPTTVETTITTEILIFTEIPSTTPTTISTREIIESTSASSIMPVTTSFKITVPTMKLTTTTLSPLITNTTLRETPYTTIFTTFLTTTEGSISTTESTTAIFLTTLSILENTTVSSTTATITTEILESTISPIINLTITTPFITKMSVATPIMIETTSYETTPASTPTIFSTEITESMTFSTMLTSTISPLKTYEITEYKEYYETSTEKEIATTVSTIQLRKEERITSRIITEESTIVEITTPITYLSSLTTPFFETTTEATTFKTVTLPTVTSERITSVATSEKMSTIEEVITATFTTIAKETLLMKEITNFTSTTMAEEISTVTEVTLISTEKSTTSAVVTSIMSSLISATVTTPSILSEIITETTETSLTTAISLPTTEKPEYITISKGEVTATFTPFSESTESALITSKTPVTTLEIMSVLPKTIEVEEFTESPWTTYMTESSTLFIETTTYLAISTSAATTEEMPEVETEYYVAKEPLYEEYEEYDTEIPTDKWYEYDEYETTAKEKTLSTEKLTELPKEKTVLTTTSSRTPYTFVEEEFTLTSTAKTSIPIVTETTSKTETESTASTVTEEEESTTTGLTFGSTEEYILPSSTVFEITTKPLPLEYPTVSPEYTESTESTLQSSTEMWRDLTLPKFVTKPEEIPEIELERATVSERMLTVTREVVEKLTSFFVSPVLTTLSEEEAVKVRVTAASTGSPEMETATETSYEITTWATITTLITEEENITYVTPFVAPETEFESTTSKTVGREKQREQLLQRLDRLEQYQREMAEKEEKMKEKERQWDREKEERVKMMRYEKEEAENITEVTSTTAGYVTSAVTNLTATFIISTENLTLSTTAEIEITSILEPTSITTLNFSLPENITISIASTPFYATEKSTPVTYITEMIEQTTTEESTTYVTVETEEIAAFYTTEKSKPVTYITEMIEETITEESTTYVAGKTEGTAAFYTTEKSKPVTYITEMIEQTTTEESTTYVAVETEKIALYTTEKSVPVTYITEMIEQITAEENTTYVAVETEETAAFYITEKSTPVTYTTEMIEQTTTEESTIYVAVETEKMAFYTTERSTPTTYITEETEEINITDYTVFTPHITAPTVDLYGISFSSVEVTTPYTTEETYSTSYGTVYLGEPSFTSPTLVFTGMTITSIALSTTTEGEYDEEIESLKEKLRKKERELEAREKMLLERENKLEIDIMDFERRMKEFEREEALAAPTERSTVRTSLSTPVPPTERTTAKAEVTTQAKTERKENRTTTKMVTSQLKTTKMKGIEEEWTERPSEKATTRREEEIVTKRICLNVLENTTIPLDKKRRGIVTKKICLPYFPEKNKKNRSVGRLNRKLFAFQNTRAFRRPTVNHQSDYRFRKRRQGRVTETAHKISNLQLSHNEWLNNETTKTLQHFEGFTRIYQKTRQPSSRSVTEFINTQENTINNTHDRTPLYERRVLDHYENFSPPTTMSILGNKKSRKRSASFEHSLISEKRDNFFTTDIINVEKSYILSTEENAGNVSSQTTIEEEESDEDENGSYTVNVVQLGYNEDEETHKVVSAKPDELTTMISESNNDNYVTDFEENDRIIAPYEFQEEEEDDEVSSEAEKKIEEENDYIEDTIENYMNYEEHETTLAYDRKFLDRSEDKKMTKSKAEDKMWPTEKVTTYHVGGTRFWQLDFEVTEPSVFSTAESKTVEVSVTKTTCLDVILKNERNSYSEMKRNINDQKLNFYNNDTKKYNIEKQNLRESNHYKQNSEKKRMIKLDEFPLSVPAADNKNLVIAKSRKLCGVNENKKYQNIKHKDAKNAKDKNKTKQLTKSQKSQNVTSHFLKNCTDSCIKNKKNSDKRHKAKIIRTIANHYSQVEKSDKKNNAKSRLNIATDHKNKSISHERKLHDCLNCICDIMNVINNIKSILDRKNFPLDEIKAFNCSEYKGIQDKIVISMNSDMEEARAFPQPHYNTESLKGQKYIKLEELEDNFKSDLEFDSDHDIISLPGLNLNLPCNQDGDGITWLSSVSRPSYTWKRTDGIALFGFVAENGDLELQNVNAKDTGNYTCVMTYIGPDNEEPMEMAYEVHLQVVTLPRYILHGENRYHTRSCDERDVDVLVTYLPLKLNSVICEADICNAYVLAPTCSRNQITVNVLIVPSHIVKLMTVDPKHCNVLCLKAIQDKLSLILSRNLQIFLGKTIIFRLPHYEQRLVPIVEKTSFTRWKRGRTGANTYGGRSSNVGVFSSCPAGYGLRGTRCVPCNMDTYSEDGISHCKKCPPGTYQPNHGARVCRTCTNPLTKGCHNMLWNSFSAIMVTLASFSVMLSIFLLLLWIICCAKKKFCVKQLASMVPKEGTIEQEEHMEEQPLIKNINENEDQQWDNEYKIKRKKGKFYVNKKRRRQNERKKYEKTHLRENGWGSHRIKNASIICPDSYRSHEDYSNYYPMQYRKGPRLPEYDFDT